MKILTLVIWLICFPLAMDIGNYFNAKRKKITGEEIKPHDSSWEACIFLGMIVVILIFQK